MFAAGVLLVVGNAPVWCVAIALAARGVAHAVAPAARRRRTPHAACDSCSAPSPRMLVVAVALSFRTLNGLAAGTALLVVMGALKLVESRARRDDAIVVGVALFLLLAAALADQALWRVPLYLLAVWGACAAIALVAHRGGALDRARRAAALGARAGHGACRWRWRVSCSSRASAGQFWALQRGAQRGHRPVRRDVAGQHRQARQRIRSGVPRALRGHDAAAAGALYWRGPVLNGFDGFTWRRERAARYLADAARAARRAGTVTASRSSPPTSPGCSRSTPWTRSRAATCSCRTIGSCSRACR